MQDLMFLQWCWWRFMFYGIWCHVHW